MAKSKSSKKGAKSAEPSPALNGVKAGRVTKPAEDSKKKSKDTAKATAKAVQKQLEKKEKKKKRKAPSPSPSSDEESAATSDSSASSASEDDGNSDVSVDKASAKPTTKAGKVTKPESSDDDSDSDASDSDADAGAPKANGSAKNAAAKDDSSDDSEASDDSDDSEADAKPAKANGVNGTKTTGAKDESSDGSEDESDDSADGETKKVDKDSDDGSEDDSESDASEIDSVAGDSKPATKGPEQKKRKADSDSGPAVKRTKHNGEPLSEPSKNLFVGSLSWNVDEDWLYREFEIFSPVAVRVITRPEDGKSKGFGYVEFNTVEEATAALDAKQGAEVDGRNLNIDFGKVRPDRSYSNDQVNNRAQKFGDRAPNEPSATLFVGNVSFGADQNMLSEAFSEYGTVNGVRLPTDPDSGEMKGYGYIEFSSVEEATAAYNALNGADIGGRNIRLDYAGARPDRGDGGGRGGRGRGGFGGGRGRGRGGFGDRGGRGGRGGARGGRGNFSSTNRGGFGDFKGKKMTF